MLGSRRQFCDGITRRETLKVGVLSVLGGFGLPQLLQAEQQREHVWNGKAKSVICLYLLGGAPWQDMYDLKPNAQSDVRGEFNPIATNVPGIQVCEHLPLHAKGMDRSAIVRSINHRAGCHNCIPSYTGWEFPETDLGNLKPTHPPSMGSVCEYLSGARADSPAYVYMPCYLGWGQAIRRPGPTAGFLGSQYDPLYSECAPYVDKPPEDAYNPHLLHGHQRAKLAQPSQGRQRSRHWPGDLATHGFVSINSDEEPGTLTTRSLVFLGDALVVNANATGGSLRIEALDPEGSVIEGFSIADCTPITTDSVRHVLKWKDNPDCHLLQGRPIKLRFHLKNARLYAFEPRIRHNHYLQSYE